MFNNPIFIILTVSVLTYLPRLLPFIFLENVQYNTYIKRFLKIVPFTTLTALIFPGILTSTGDSLSAFFGGVTCIVLSYLELKLVYVLVSSISVVLIYNLVF